MRRRGLLLGKFHPPHAGHRFLAETALQMTDETTVLVCSTRAEPIPGEQRLQWIRAMLPAARVLHLRRELPQRPDDHPDFWAIWRTAILETLRVAPTHVFASEQYVFRLAQELGAKPVLVDPNREVFPVSGSAILSAPHEHWGSIPRAVRPYFQKRLTLLGPESAGKTTLAHDIAAAFKTRVMPEYGRVYDAAYKQGKNWAADDLVALAETHRAIREAMRGSAGPLLVEDTDAVQTAVWAQFLVGAVAPALDAIERDTLSDYYLLLAPDVDWVEDGVRYAGDAATRGFFFEEAKRRLQRRGVSHAIIQGRDWTRRRAAAIDAARRRFPDLA